MMREPLLPKLLAARECACHVDYGLTYQKCRFCGAGWPEQEMLWKYAVRHYICSACRTKKIREAGDAPLRIVEAK